MNVSFDETELDRLSAEVDAQLQELQAAPAGAMFKSISGEEKALPAKQFAAIEQATGEPPEGFLRKFSRSARKDLCEEGGLLYGQWQQWADLRNEDTLKTFKAVLVSMGVTGEVLPLVLVAATVITLHLGAKTICEEYGQEEA